MGYQSAATETGIVALRDGGGVDPWREQVIDLVRRTRSHPDVRIGSSVRGAIDLVAIAARLAAGRGVAPDDWHAGLDAALVALSGRIRMLESSVRPPEDVVRELYIAVFGAEPSASSDAGSDPSGGQPGEA
jgi:MoxR-like ATPase